MARTWIRPELKGERSLVLMDGQNRVCAAYCGIATGGAVKIYLARGWSVVTIAPIKPAAGETTCIGANIPLTEASIDKCAASWKIYEFPVVVFLGSTPREYAMRFRRQAQAQPVQEDMAEFMHPRAAAEAMRTQADALVAIHNLYIALERRLEGATTLEEAIQVERIDPEVARKILRHRENVGYLRQVFEAIVKAGLNGDFSIVDAYRGIEPPTQLQARLAIDVVIAVVEIMFRLNRNRVHSDLVRQYPSINAFELGDIVDMGIAALFMNNACWGENGTVENHEAISAANYALMRRHMPSLPEIEDLMAHHSRLWPHDWVYLTRVAMRRLEEGIADEICRIRYQLGSGPGEARDIEREVRSVLALADLQSLGILHDVNVWPAEPGIVLRIAILSIAEQIVHGQQQDSKTLNQIFAELARVLIDPPPEPYAIQDSLYHGLHLFSHTLAAAATEYRIFPRGAIILFVDDANEASSEPAHQVAVDGGIALSLGGGPEELLLFSHDRADGILEKPSTIQEFLQPVLGTNGLPKPHFFWLTGTNDLIFRHRAVVLAIASGHSVQTFLKPWSELITQARKIIGAKNR